MRSSPVSSERPLRVHTFRPRSRVGGRWVRNATICSTLIGAGLGGVSALTPHPPAKGKTAAHVAASDVVRGTLAGGALGLGAGLGGSLLYALLGGPIGAVAGVAGAVALSAGGLKLGSRLTNAPELLQSGAQDALGYIPTTPLYVPVFYDPTVKEEKPPPAPPYNGPWNDRVLFLGMNPSSVAKAVPALRRHAEVTAITSAKFPDHVYVNGKWMELGSTYGIKAFVKTLGLNKKSSEGVYQAIDKCETGARDELGQLAMVWAQGEKGAHIPSRMVLAGHSNGDGVWGDNNGSLRLGPLLLLSRALPHATSQIEDAFVTGCYSGGEVTMDQYLLIFPRAKTIWAYDASAPGVDNGATIDQGGWEEATRGRNSSVIPSKSKATGRAMATWSATTNPHYHAPKPPLNLAGLRGQVQWLDEHFTTPALNGEDEVKIGADTIPIRITDPQTGLVRQYYTTLARLTQRKDMSDDERLQWNDKKQQTIRLLYYNATVAPHFASFYAADIASGYHDLGLPVPNFATLPRSGAVKAVHEYLARLKQTAHPSSSAQNLANVLQRGVLDLDSHVIPNAWI